MNDSADLERRYRRVLAAYPRAFRREHEQEILAVLMAGADEGQHRPRLGAAANLIKHALWMRLGLSGGEIMINERTFAISVDRPSRTLTTAFGAGRKAPQVTMSPSTVNVRMGWAFHAMIPRKAVASARPWTEANCVVLSESAPSAESTTGHAPPSSTAPVPD